MVTSAQSFLGRPRQRPGTVLPLVALTIVAQLSFLALAIDLGMVAISKTQVQQAADLVALTAARSLNGSSTGNYNQSAATTNAQNILSYNRVLGSPIQASQLQLTYGSYDYSQTTQSFSANYPSLTGSPTTAVTATVTSSNSPASFSKVLGTQLLPTVSATAQAVHRPRDLALVMDLSGSMRMGTCLGFDFYPTSRTSNNPDALIPTFGQYSSNNANLQGPTTNQTSNDDELYDLSQQYDCTKLLIRQNLREQLLSKRRLRFDPDPGFRFLYQHGRRQYLDCADLWRAGASAHIICHRTGGRCSAFQVGEHHDVRHGCQGCGKQYHQEQRMGARRLLELHERFAFQRGRGTEQLYKCALQRLYARTRLLRRDLLHLAS